MNAALRSRLPWLFTFAVIFTIGIVLRAYNLESYSLWQDEAHTWLFTRLSWSDFFEAVRITGVHPPFYFILDKLAVSVFGDSEIGLRLISVVADLVSILLAMGLGWQIGGPPGAAAAGWFWSFNPFTLWYAQDARPYALAALLSMASITLFLRAMRQGSFGSFLAVSLTLAAGLLTHYFFFLVVGSLILVSLLDLRRSPSFFRRWAVISLCAMIPLTIWLVWFFLLPQPSLGIGWIQTPILSDPLLTIWNFMSGYGGKFSILSTMFGVLAASAILTGLFGDSRSNLGRRLLFIGVLLSLTLTWVVSFRRPIYIDRYFIVLYPFLIPVMAGGSSTIYRYLKGKGTFWTVAATSILLIATGLFNAWQMHTDVKYAREDWKNMAIHLAAQRANGEGFWFLSQEMIPPFEYYYRSAYTELEASEPPACAEPCYWVLRQPYTLTHAFTQAITDPARPWRPELPPSCGRLDIYENPGGIALWKIKCE